MKRKIARTSVADLLDYEGKRKKKIGKVEKRQKELSMCCKMS